MAGADDLVGAWGKAAGDEYFHLGQRPDLKAESLAEGGAGGEGGDVLTGEEGDHQVGLGDIGGGKDEHGFTIAAKGGAGRVRLRTGSRTQE